MSMTSSWALPLGERSLRPPGPREWQEGQETTAEGIMGRTRTNPGNPRDEDHMLALRTACSISAMTLAVFAAATSASAQLRPPEVRGLRGAPFPSMNPPPDVRSFGEGPAWDGKAPDGIQPLPLDMFTSKDFYKDKALWTD